MTPPRQDGDIRREVRLQTRYIRIMRLIMAVLVVLGVFTIHQAITSSEREAWLVMTLVCAGVMTLALTDLRAMRRALRETRESVE